VVLIFELDGSVASPGRPAADRELARHKLLDLLGDAYLLGGPPIGSISALRPGHAANQRALREALASGLVARQAP
jgi:UDP-3-O-[3-hydroxymyristoyl] N-acetylglucosamine deacetylase